MTIAGGSLCVGTWIDTLGRAVEEGPEGARECISRCRRVTQRASAHSCASANSTAITPSVPRNSSRPTSTLETVRYCCV